MNDEETRRLFALLEIPSVSADPAHADDMARAADLVAAEIERAGGTATIQPGDPHPLVRGEVPASSGDRSAPRVLVYGHYDVQPPGELSRWTSPPFVPTVRDGNLYARGASDDKGNLFMLLVAIQRLRAAGRLPVRVGVIADGEEESGGTAALSAVAAEAEPAAACVIFDIPMVDPGLAALCTGVRGLLYRRVRLTTAEADGHSGLFGGAAANAAHALGAVLAAIVPVAGRLPEAIERGSGPVSQDERDVWAELPAGERMLADAGLGPADSAAGAEFYERTLARASLDVHALSSGDVDRVATSIPGQASATLSVRLAPGQDPAAVSEALAAALRAAAPAAATLEVDALHDVPPALMDPAHPALRAGAEGLRAATGRPPALVRVGGTIPIVGALVAAGTPVVLTGFALPTDSIHSPDEHLRVAHLALGVRAAERILSALGDR